MTKKDTRKYKYGGKFETVAGVRRWSSLATECYLRGCVCKNCFFDDFFRETRKKYGLKYDYSCKMKATVLELIRAFGSPDLNASYAIGLGKSNIDEKSLYDTVLDIDKLIIR